LSVVRGVAVDASTGGLGRHIKGQMDGIGTKPPLRAAGPDGASLVDQTFSPKDVPDVPAALQAAAEGLRRQQAIESNAVGHSIVHGRPKYDQPALIDGHVLAELERFIHITSSTTEPIQLPASCRCRAKEEGA
jgi:acetate kinase